MSHPPQPGQYRLRYLTTDELPPPPIGGMYATGSGQGTLVNIEPELAKNQIFDVHIKDGAYVILSDDNESTAWTYKAAEAEQPIFLYAEKGFQIGPVEGHKGVYFIKVPTDVIGIQLLVGVEAKSRNVVVQSFVIGDEKPKPVWQFIPGPVVSKDDY